MGSPVNPLCITIWHETAIEDQGGLQGQVDAFFVAWTRGGSGVAYTPQGLAVAGSEGGLRNAASAALLALVHARHGSGFGAVRLACWARDQVYPHPPVTAWFPTPAVAP